MRAIEHATILTPAPDGLDVRILPDHTILFDQRQVVALGPADALAERVAREKLLERIDGRRRIVTPGFVNTHHHLYQSLTRCLPAVQNKRLFDWLVGLYPNWRSLDAESVRLAAMVSIAELLLHGCTTTSDHFYMFPRGTDAKPEHVLEAAEALGLRIHLCRGAMTLGQSRGGLPPDDCVEDDDAVLADCRRMLERWHDADDYALRRIDLAPCSPFNVTETLLCETAAMARDTGGVLLHTHLAETLDEQRYCLRRFGCKPLEYLDRLGFLGPDVYLAHCVYLDEAGIRRLAETGTGVSHCPTSNMRLASGIAPIRELLAAGVRVGLGVDGSSSNDGGNILAEARQALLVDRLRTALDEATHEPPDGPRPDLTPARYAFLLATRGGAACLNRPVLGHLNPGAAADLAVFRADAIELAGAAAHDPLAALVLCDAPRAEFVFVAGRPVVREGQLVALDAFELGQKFNEHVAARIADQ